MFFKEVKDYLQKFTKEDLKLATRSLDLHAIGGGSINAVYKLTINNTRTFFLKVNDFKKFPFLFEKEKNGLNFIAGKKIMKTPAVVDIAVSGDCQVLLLEWIEQGLKPQISWEIFGEQLAQLHKVTQEDVGFYEDNYMGALPQNNTCTKNWVEFFIHHRLQPQINLALQKQLLMKKQADRFERLYMRLTDIFNEESPSLLHGDLWSGNFLCDENRAPVLIDPAVYFGHRCMDLAMSTLFGGFEKKFYESYNYHFPFPGNYREQWNVCNLYPLLIHLNLFGRGYLDEIELILKKF